MMFQWQTRRHQVPAESWTFVWVAGEAFGLFLSLRPDGDRWRGFVLTNARNNADLLSVRWSADVMAEHFAEFGEAELEAAQRRLVEILAQRLGVMVEFVEPARNGKPVERRRLSGPQVYQVAKFQPPRRR